MIQVICADSIEYLRTLEESSLDSCVTDSPYGLSQHTEELIRSVLSAWLAGKPFDPSGLRGFMGKTWDGFVPGPEFWREVYRVLKPGSHCLVFAGTRSFDLMAISLRLAGFEIRDTIHASGWTVDTVGWVYGSGFPKSLDVSKTLDKIDRSEVVDERARTFTDWMRSTGITVQQINDATKSYMGSHYLTDKSQPRVATADLFDLLRPLLPPVPEEIEELVRSRMVESENMKKRKVIGVQNAPRGHAFAGEIYGVDRPERSMVGITKPHSYAARQWEGWGTALKPAWEPIIIARKPLIGTVAENVTRYGTGAINVDGCRVNPGTHVPGGGNGQAHNGGKWAARETSGSRPIVQAHNQGRWPPNLLLIHHPECEQNGEARACVPDCSVGAMDRQSGTLKSDGASRFFPQFQLTPTDLVPFLYCAKASRSEREAGCDALPARTGAEAVDREEGSAGTQSPRAGAGRTASSVKNHHPTVKPAAIMRWLVRLVTPPGGVVLDPFLGSGTTGVAAVQEGFHFLGIEREVDHHAIAQARVAYAAGGVEVSGAFTAKAPMEEATMEETPVEEKAAQPPGLSSFLSRLRESSE